MRSPVHRAEMFACSKGLLDRNPATSLFTPRHYQKGKVKLVLAPGSIVCMLEALELRERLIARFAILEGMRPSEILGLQHGDLDVDSVWVRRRIFKSNVDTPKTDRSARRVALSLGTLDLLMTWIDGLVLTDDSAWLFPAATLATPIWVKNIWRRNFAPKLKPLDLEWATFRC